MNWHSPEGSANNTRPMALREGISRTGREPVAWLSRHRAQGSRIVGVELADEAIRLADLNPSRERTIVVLGHERDGIPEDVMELIDVAVEIPMIGMGASLNVAVAGSLVLYRLAGLL